MPLNKKSTISNIFYILITSVLSYSCTLQRIANYAERKQEITIQPVPLAASGDEVKFEIEASVPQRLISKKRPYKLDVFYEYGENKREYIATLSFQYGEFLYENRKPTITKNLSFPYTRSKKDGRLLAQGRVIDAKTEEVRYTSTKQLATGILTTPLSVVKENEVLYIPSAYSQHKNDAEQLSFYFEKDEYRLRDYVGANLKTLDQYVLDNVEEQTIHIIASQSPEEPEEGLAARRAAAVKEYYLDKISVLDYTDKKVTLTTDHASDYRQELAHKVQKSALPKKQADEILAVINNSGSLAQTAEALKNTQAYNYLQKYIYPTLQAAHFKINYKLDQKPDYQLYLLAQKIADKKANPDQLTPTEMLYAATLTPLLAEKRKLYEASVKLTDKWPAYFNLGVVYLEMAAKEYRTEIKQRLLDEAIQHLSYAGYRHPTAEVHYSLASAQHMRSRKPKALESYNYAIRMGGDSSLLARIFADKAALEIEMGLYDDAIASLRYAGDSYQTQMNLGLSYLLKENYEGATCFYNLALAHKPDDAMAHYYLAVVGARSNDEQMMENNLRNAVRNDRSLIEKAVEDLEFRAYRGTAPFEDALIR